MKENKGKISRSSMFLLLFLLGAGCLFIYHSYLLGSQVLVFTDIGSDTKEQYLPWYHNIASLLKSSGLTGWDFQDGLGATSYNLNLFAPFLWLVYLVGTFLGPDKIAGSMVYLLILEIILAGECCYLMLSAFDFSEDGKVFSSFMYGFNGYLLIWGQHYSLGSVMVFLPLFILFVEKSIHHKRALFGVAMISGLGLLNGYYQGYMMILGVAIYVTLRCLIYEEAPFGKRVKDFVYLALSMAAGIGIGAINLLPSYGAVSETARLNSDSSILGRMIFAMRPWSREYYRTLLYRFFGSSLQGAGNGFVGTGNYYEAPCMFFSVLFILLLGQYVLTIHRQKKSLSQKICQYIGILTAIFMVGIRAGSLPFNAFAYEFSRHTFLLMPLFAIVSSKVLTQMWEERIFSVTGLILSAGAMAAVYAKAYTNYTDPIYETNSLMLFFGGLSMAAVLILYYRKKMELSQVRLLLGVLLFVTTMSDGALSVRYRQTVRKTDSTYSSDTYQGDTMKALSYIREMDPGYYRIEKDYAEGAEYLDSMIQQYNGVSTYNSMQTAGLIDFVAHLWPQLRTGYDRNHHNFRSSVHEEVQASLVGVKYLLSHDDTLTVRGYERIHQEGEVYIYRNTAVENTAHFYTKTAYVSDFEEKEETIDVRNLLPEVLLLGSEQEADMEKSDLAAYERQQIDDAADVSFIGSGVLELKEEWYRTNERVYIEFSLQSDESAPMNIYVGDERKIEYLNADSGHFNITIPEGTAEIRFEPLDAEEEYRITNIKIYGSKECTEFSKEAGIEVNRGEGSSVEGSVDAKTAGYVLLTVPLQAGWKLYVDGEEKSILAADYNFMAFPVSEGRHTFKVIYEVPYFNVSKMLTIGSLAVWIVAFALSFVYIRRKRSV